MCVKKALCKLIEEKAGFEIKTPADFSRLAEMIIGQTGSYISVSTLKRLFGYIEGWQNPRPGVWNILSRFVGFANEEAFRKASGLKQEAISGEVMNDVVRAVDLNPGAEIELRWYPDHCMLVRHTEDGNFLILKVVGTHLKPGGTFHADSLVAQDSLLLNPYYPPAEIDGSRKSVLYEIGRTGGIEFTVIQQE